ncbi:MAG TPA: tetraacyldisaccharide 4'-kinase [Pyrinomonadaceae bacterium]|nr:tetraacyldisaccharide 4'-kinase [Pyrinomonadaceae bacterium]
MKLLLPFGKLYGGILELRNRLYDRGILRVHDLGARTISIGNLTVGGTGKTPLVALTARILAESGEKVCVLTRGYGRTDPKSRVLVSDWDNVLADAATGGDEPVELARILLGKAIVIADRDRVSAARWAKKGFGVTAFVLDDGFQHRKVRRDLDIVCIDATNPCGNGHLLPAGILREPFKGLSRADAIVLTRSDLVDSPVDIVGRLKRRNENAPVYLARQPIRKLVNLSEVTGKVLDDAEPGSESVVSDDAGPLFAFCGLGNPGSFRLQLDANGFLVVGQRSFPDHHRYTTADIRKIEQEAAAAGASGLVTTYKDAVKLEGLRFGIPVRVAIADAEIDNDASFRGLLINGRKPGT